MAQDYEIFDLGRVELQSGGVLPAARLAYKTYGTLNDARDNVIVLPTHYTGTHRENERMLGPGRALDAARYFIVSINMFGNGISSSPSNSAGNVGGADFPNVTLNDNIRCQHLLLTERFQVKRVRLVTGWSMGGCQSYEWAAQFPDFVDAILPYCGSAKTSVHNIVFLEGVKAALLADPAFEDGRYVTPPVRGLKAFGRVYAGWAYSQTFFREGLYRKLGHATHWDLLDGWGEDHLIYDANDLLAMLWSWQRGDIGANDVYRGDFTKALGAIKARAILLPCDQDLYFPPEDNEIEAKLMRSARLERFDSPWGHCIPVPPPGGDPDFARVFDQCVAELLA
jgi:homoserine O-acetyltransferase/O-succinyltransferase